MSDERDQEYQHEAAPIVRLDNDDNAGDDGGDEREWSQDEIEGLACQVEALLFVSSCPMSARRLADLLELKSVVPIRRACEWLATRFEGHAFSLERLAGGYQFLTHNEYERDVLRLQKQRKAQKLTPGALETLAIIAYKQPITRAELDAIRGVSSDHHMRNLAERNLVKIVGRQSVASGTGPALYGTTTDFLNAFGLRSLRELPAEDDGSPSSVPNQSADDVTLGNDEDEGDEFGLEIVEVRTDGFDNDHDADADLEEE